MLISWIALGSLKHSASLWSDPSRISHWRLEIPSGKEHRQCCQCHSLPLPSPPSSLLPQWRRRRRYGNVGKGVDRLARLTDGFHRWCECRCDYRQLSFAIYMCVLERIPLYDNILSRYQKSNTLLLLYIYYLFRLYLEIRYYFY